MKKILLNLLLLCAINLFAQTSEVIISVDWPNWSSENKVELYAPGSNTPINNVSGDIIQNLYDGVANNSYNTSQNYGFLTNDPNTGGNTGYRVIVYDLFGDGWNNGGTMTITVDGVTVLNYNENSVPDLEDLNNGSNGEETQTIYFVVEDPAPILPGDSEFDTSGNEYIEYIHGNLPIIISAPHGGVKQSGSTIGGVNYPDNDSSLSDRSCGTNERDDNTDILLREIQDEIFALTGCYAHVIISNLHRSKLDPNREQNEATCGDADALFYWNTFHNFIDDASTSVEANWGKGLYIDLHGQSHGIQRIEAGYNISGSQLDAGNVDGVSGTSITNLVANNLNNYTQEQLVRGPFSLGEYFQDAPGIFYNANNNPGCGVTSGYRTVPSNTNHGGGNSCDDTTPHGNAYFDGDFYNNVRHGSGSAASDGLGGGGNIDGIMTEVNRRVRDLGTYNGSVYDTRPQTLVPFAKDYAAVVLEFIDKHYNDFATFNYDNAAYDVTDSDPTPTINGVSGGVFSSTAGLAIDANTGEIDVSDSTVGNYVVTYTTGTCGYYNATQNIEIEDETLGLVEANLQDLKIYPNPVNSIINFRASNPISKVELYSAIGHKLFDIEVNSNQGQLDMSKLPTGFYILSIYNENFNNAINKQIIKH